MKKIGKSIIIITILFALVFIFSNCVSAAVPTKTLITQTPTGGAENSQSNNPVTSADGRYVAFESGASNIGTGSSGRGIQDIYVYDRQTNVTEWITHTPSGGAANGNSYSPSISGDGRYVAFASNATNLGPGGSGNGIKDIYVYDRNTKVMKWITHDPNGGPASNYSNSPVISADGKWLAFQSTAKNLGTGGSEYYVEDIYIYDFTSNAPNNYPVWITHTTEGKTANGASMNPTISADGRYIAFVTTATNLGTNPYIRYGTGGGIKDIFVYDRTLKIFKWTTIVVPELWSEPKGGIFTGTKTITLNMNAPGKIYYTLNGIGSTYTEYVGPITIDSSTYIHFYGISNNISSSIISESYILQNSNPIVWASPSNGVYYNSVNVTLQMNMPGAIYYSTDGSFPTKAYTGSIEITESTTLQFIGITSTGEFSTLVVENYKIIKTPIGGLNPSISSDGSLLAFQSGNNIYIYNMNTGMNVLLTQTTEGEAANGENFNPSLSGDGNTLTFETTATNLGIDPKQPFGSGSYTLDIFIYSNIRDIFKDNNNDGVINGVNNANMNWVTKNPNYGPANGNSYTPSLNYDGKVLAYSSSANNLGPGGSGVYRDIFLEDSGLQVLADKAAGNYEGPLTVTLSLINGTGNIYYTTNGSDPQTSAGILYIGPITITSDTLLRYSGRGPGGVWTLNYSRNYTINKPLTVTANPAGGTYTSVITVTLTTINPGSTATTYYTTDGSDPKTSGTRITYSNPIQIASTTTLRYVAVDPDGNWSPNYSQTYIINLPIDTVTIAQLNSAAASVRKYYETHSKKLPNSTTINGKTYTMAQFLYLLVTATVNMNTNNLNPITAKTVNSAPRPSGTIKSGNILKTKYISYAKSIQNFININGRAPNFVITTLGNMQFKYIVYMYTKIVNYFVSNKRLPNNVAMTK